MTSLQTRLARADSEAARRTWNRHRGRCEPCARIVRETPKPGQEPCGTGRSMLDALALSRQIARSEAAKDREAAKYPPEGMDPLFDLSECD